MHYDLRMKTTALFLMLAAVLSLHAADEKKLPPGLQKKGKLPPGWEKKVGPEEKKATDAASGATNLPAPATNVARTATNVPAAPAPAKPRAIKEVRSEVTDRIEAINKMDNRPALRQAGLDAAARELGIDVSVFQRQKREHPDTETAGLIIANELARQTKKRPAVFLSARDQGKRWVEIASEHKADLEAVSGLLGRVEKAMHGADTTQRKSK